MAAGDQRAPVDEIVGGRPGRARPAGRAAPAPWMPPVGPRDTAVPAGTAVPGARAVPGDRAVPAGAADPGAAADADVAPGGPVRAWPVLLAVLMLLFGYVATHRYPAPAQQGATSDAPAQAAARGPGTQIGPGPPGLRLLVGGVSPRVVDTASGQWTRLELPGVGPSAPAWLVRAGHAVLALVPTVPDDPFPRVRQAYLVRPGAAARLLGLADGAIAARDGGLITVHWTGAGTVLTGFSAGGARSWQWRNPVRLKPEVDTGYGLLVRQLPDATHPDGGPLRLVDAGTGAVRQEIAATVSNVLASRIDTVAWLGAGPCPPDCSVRLTDLVSGHSRTVAIHPGHTPLAGAFSPDGRLLALTFEAGLDDGPSRYPDGLVSLVDVGSRKVSVVRGYGGGIYPPAWVAWSADGRLLVMMTAAGGRERLRVSVSQQVGSADSFTLLPWAFLATASLTVAP